MKRLFDIVFSLFGLLITSPFIAFFLFLVWSKDKSNPLYIANRVGVNGNEFKMIKIRTMKINADKSGVDSTSVNDPRITRIGSTIRKYKIDELPQLINVVLGHMSFVGPRPDVPGYADRLVGEERRLLSVRPGITGPATLKYRNEEQLLAAQDDPERYNQEVVWPDKVRINLDYIQRWSLAKDMRYIWQTFFR